MSDADVSEQNRDDEIGLSSVVGQDRAVGSLRSAIGRDAVAHAYLFTGPDGVGKRRTAIAFFAALLCERRPGEGCGACRQCRPLLEDTHPDVRRLVPEGASRIIRIDPVRQLSRALAYPPVLGAFKCVLIEDADRFNEAAGNALLKTLEEPSSRTVFVLLSAAPHRMLATILSRCQKLPFGALARDEVAGWLVTRRGVAPDVADTVAGMAEGSLGQALEQLDEEKLALRQTWFQRFSELGQRDVIDVLGWADEMGAKRPQLEAALELLRSYLRDVVVLAAGATADAVANRDALPRLRAHAETLRPEAPLSWLDLVEEATGAMQVNTNGRSVAERVLLEIAEGSRPVAARGAR